jgi:hypothetical protein
VSAHAWNIDAATAEAKRISKPVLLTPPDGFSSGLVVTPAGDVRRAVGKPEGKAARKEFKKLRRQLREMAETKTSPSSQRIIARKMRNLCTPVVIKKPVSAEVPAVAAHKSDPFPDKDQKRAYTEAFLKGNADARAGREFINPHKGADRVLESAYWAGWNSGGGKSQESPPVAGGAS